jgi:glucose-6-phosphate isomerase
MKQQASTGAIYGTGVIGALIYFLTHAQGFQGMIFGIIQAFFWPGVLVYKALELLKI